MRSNPIKHAMKFGLIIGVIQSANFLLSNVQISIIQLLSTAISISTIYLIYRFTVHYRNSECRGQMTYGQGISYIVWLYLFAAIISSLVKYLYWQFINPEFLPEFMNKSLLMLETMKIEITDEMIEQMKRMQNPRVMALQFVWFNVLGGFILSLIIAAFTRKEKSIFDEENT